MKIIFDMPEGRDVTLNDILKNVPNDDAEAFEFEGVTITDRNKSPCGRFDLTPEESKDLYGE